MNGESILAKRKIVKNVQLNLITSFFVSYYKFREILSVALFARNLSNLTFLLFVDTHAVAAAHCQQALKCLWKVHGASTWFWFRNGHYYYWYLRAAAASIARLCVLYIDTTPFSINRECVFPLVTCFLWWHLYFSRDWQQTLIIRQSGSKQACLDWLMDKLRISFILFCPRGFILRRHIDKSCLHLNQSWLDWKVFWVCVRDSRNKSVDCF